MLVLLIDNGGKLIVGNAVIHLSIKGGKIKTATQAPPEIKVERPKSAVAERAA